MSNLIDPRDFAKEQNVSIDTVYRWMRQGLLGSVKVKIGLNPVKKMIPQEDRINFLKNLEKVNILNEDVS